jgi:hypothetical protein
MHGLDVIYHEHREILRLTEAVMQVASEMAICASKLTTARHALGQAGAKHILNKLAIVTRALQDSPDPAHHQLARRFTDELTTLRQSASEHYRIWTIAQVQADPREYRMAVRTQQRQLKARVAWEEAEVLPIVATLLADPVAMARRA